MDNIVTWLSSFSVDRSWLVLGLILVSVMIFVFLTGFVLIGSKTVLEQRMSGLASQDNSKKESKIKDTLESLSPIYITKDAKERENVRSTLMHAGYHSKSALANFYALKFVSFTLGVVVAGMLFVFFSESSQVWTIMMLSIFIGLVLPNYILNNLAKKRQSKIRAGIPDALDLLVVCTESGLGFLAALKRVAGEIYISHPELADELDTICVKIKAGVELPKAFTEFVVRTGLVEINGLVSMLSHASRVGGSLASTLRDYNEDYRDKRNQAAEELAAKIPTKMVFPMLLFIWPCFFIVAIGPAILALIKAFE
ncbi:type II secretion system F family protein [Vibrio sp. SCSIO 43140]|uniref:type II secretion system F family protein n=1 Tax=Vibrio sp. SCSIO 43140 TaxID=2819100 RepID=UPI002074B16B|nr:type II secretion system F family protein [Vibrio sp. SCSIO 43140]USD61780.1 type II secretion system F family protein [Vibrio sp. SCSIO 43140]